MMLLPSPDPSACKGQVKFKLSKLDLPVYHTL